MELTALMHEQISLDQPSRWAAALRGIPHASAHTWGHCHALSLTTGHETFLYRYQDEHGQVVCPFAVRSYDGFRDLVTPYGFSGFVGVGECAEFPARWASYAREQEFVCGYVQLNPLLHHRLYPPAETHTVSSAFLLDLSDSEADLYGRLGANRQRQVRDSEREPISIITQRDILAQFFSDTLPSFLDERRAAPIYYLSKDTIDALFALDHVIPLGVAVNGRLEAVSVFAYTPHIADWLYHVCVPGARHHTAPLIWQGALRLRSLGIPVLNLGGGVRADDGVAAFKRRFGGAEKPLRALRQVYRAELYGTLCRQAGMDPDSTGYFPPYHAS